MGIAILLSFYCIYGFSNFRNRSQLFLTTFIIALSYAVCYIALNIIIEGGFSEIDWLSIGYLGISALLTLLAYPLIYAFEKVFSFISDVTLLELADTNNKLLRELSRKAPGTFQHSLQVANLAETATSIIGGNTLLIRTAALYHDIGKIMFLKGCDEDGTSIKTQWGIVGDTFIVGCRLPDSLVYSEFNYLNADMKNKKYPRKL